MKGVKLSKQLDKGINISKMKDGQIAVVVDWNGVDFWNGQILQRYGKSYIVVGKERGYTFSEEGNQFEGVLVRVLEKGEQITIL